MKEFPPNRPAGRGGAKDWSQDTKKINLLLNKYSQRDNS